MQSSNKLTFSSQDLPGGDSEDGVLVVLNREEEKKETPQNPELSGTVWLGDSELALHRRLYDELGMMAMVTDFSPNTERAALALVTDHFFTILNRLYSFGSRREVSRWTEGAEDRLLIVEPLLKKLQEIVNQSNPTSYPCIEQESKNSHIIFAHRKPFPIPFSPLFLSEDIPDHGSTDQYALRIYPFPSKKGEPYESTRFKTFAIEFFMFGAEMIGIDYLLREYSIFTEMAHLPFCHKIKEIKIPPISLFEEVQFQALKLMGLMMLRLGDVGFKVVCNLHYVENILYLLMLYFQEKITPIALETALLYVMQRKKSITTRLTFFFKQHDIDIEFQSSLDNIFGRTAIPSTLTHTGYFLSKLNLSLKNPDGFYPHHEEELINECLNNIETNREYRVYYSIWEEFADIAIEKKSDYNTLDGFLKLADVISLALPSQFTSSYDVCAIRYASRIDVLYLQSEYIRSLDLKKQLTRKVRYEPSVVSRFPQRSAVDYIKPLQGRYPYIKCHPVVFNIAIMDPVIGMNLEAEPDQKTGGLYHFKNNARRHFDALSLSLDIVFFKQGAKNAAHKNKKPGHIALNETEAVRNLAKR